MNTFRHQFSDSFVIELTRFSVLHKLDDLTTYKEAWDKWCTDNDQLIEIETRRLHENNYDGDVIDKMYKAGRYYFRTKPTEPINVLKRRKYIPVSKSLICSIDHHIQENYKVGDYTPAKGFDEFCIRNETIITKEISSMLKTMDKEYIHLKLKKTYKNRYFIISRK